MRRPRLSKAGAGLLLLAAICFVCEWKGMGVGLGLLGMILEGLSQAWDICRDGTRHHDRWE